MLNKINIPIRKISILALLNFLLGAWISIGSQSDPTQRKDSPIGLVIYCPIPTEKETPFDYEKTLALWYKRYKIQKVQEGGGAILLVTAPFIPKNSPEVERLRVALGAEIIFPGSQSMVSKKETTSKIIRKKKLSKQNKKTKPAKVSNINKTPTELKPLAPKVSKKKSKSPKVSSSKKAKPVISPGLLVSKEEAGIGFAFYSPSLESIKSEKELPSPWIGDFRSQLTKNLESHSLDFLLVQDPSPNFQEETNPIVDGLRSFRPNLLEQIPSVTLLSGRRALRFFNGEYSFGCGATPDSLKLTVLELFFRNGRLIRIAEEVQTLNSNESNKSWILE